MHPPESLPAAPPPIPIPLSGRLVAYHGDPARKAFYLARVRAHRAADELIRGQYWKDAGDGVFRGCAVGCTIHSSDHATYETELGIPIVLARLEDSLFESLPVDRALAWPEEFLSAPRPGADLSLVWPRFAVWLLTDPGHGVLRFARTDRGRRAIEDVADAYTRVIHGEAVEDGVWRELRAKAEAAAEAVAKAAAAYYAYYAYAAAAAAEAAYYAYYAYAAAEAVAQAAEAACYAYYAAEAAAAEAAKARGAQADKLLELMSHA